MPFQEHPQWKAVNHIHQNLKLQGFRSLIAGGAVRDLLLGRTPNDIDIATDAKPEQVEQIFNKTVMVGKEFGVARVIIEDQDIEVASFRKDGPYKDGRKPESIEFSNEQEDAKRRDFTINAMFYDLEKMEVLDFVGGQKDIMQKTIRAVGEPALRFEEDKLRILRALRFHAQLGFVIEKSTLSGICKYNEQIHQVSMERVRDEWQKILLAEYSHKGLEKAYECGLWSHLFDDWKYLGPSYTSFFNEKREDVETTWALWFLLHHQGSLESLATKTIHWKLPKKLSQKIIYTVQSLPQIKQIDSVESVDLAIFMGTEKGRFAVEMYQALEKDRLSASFSKKLAEAQSFFNDKGNLPSLLVNGDDLIQYGVAPGPEIATQLKKLYRIQLLENIHFKEELMNKI